MTSVSKKAPSPHAHTLSWSWGQGVLHLSVEGSHHRLLQLHGSMHRVGGHKTFPAGCCFAAEFLPVCPVFIRHPFTDHYASSHLVPGAEKSEMSPVCSPPPQSGREASYVYWFILGWVRTCDKSHIKSALPWYVIQETLTNIIVSPKRFYHPTEKFQIH